MAALLLTVALFAYWVAVGYAVQSVAPARVDPRRAAMLAPAIGAAAVVVPIFWLNHLGLPVETFAAPLLAGIGIAAAAILAWRRPFVPVRRLRPYLAILLAALLLSSWPMLLYGFDWSSYNNSDMTHYSLGASRVLHSGFFDPPSLDAVVQARDYALYDAYKYINFDARAGSELMLAALWAVTGLDAQKVYMPVTIALHLALICAAAAMAAGGPRGRKASLIAAGLMAISPLTTLGAMYQLIAQVGGLAFLCASVALLFQVPRRMSLRESLLRSIPLALVMAGLFIWYPELLPFLGLGWFAYLAMVAWRDRRNAGRAIGSAAIAGVLLALLLNTYLLGAIKFMVSQALSQSGGPGKSELVASAFPYFLLPSGLPTLWGITPLAGGQLLAAGPLLSAAIAWGIGLSLWFAWGFPAAVRRAAPATAVFVVMAALAAVLFRTQKDFGLFKLAMYAQPFLLAMVAERLAVSPLRGRARKAAWAVIPLSLLGALAAQNAYVALSTGEYLRGLAEIWHGSSARINTRMDETAALIREKSPAGLISDTASIVQMQHQTLHTRGQSVLFPGVGAYMSNEHNLYPAEVAARLPQKRTISVGGKEMAVTLHPDLAGELARRWFVWMPRYDTIFNIPRADTGPEGYYRAAPPGATRNHLMFVGSDLGDHYYGYSSGIPIAFNHLEQDPMVPGRQISGLGRNFLFMVVNPTPRPRLVMEISATLMKHFDSTLPRPLVLGASNTTVDFIGRGSGRVVSAPLEPQYIDGVPFIAIDIGRAPKPYPHDPHGLMKLYNARINPDLRKLTVNGREISLVSEEEYAGFEAPSRLESFPQDLNSRGLEYSGIYEDGWISDRSFFVLQGKAPSTVFRIKGSVPLIDRMPFETRLTILADGQVLAERKLGNGEFSVEVPLPNEAGRKRRIELRWSATQQLPDDDGRMTPALISFLGLA